MILLLLLLLLFICRLACSRVSAGCHQTWKWPTYRT
jgi:hypothetical protein